ncbi:MAG TPA: ABC transporter permease subunit [Hyphomicrobiales bacterium]|nr:ABC transporter permease subunit [Hyphomicrobiales bacterium]
MKRRSSSFDLVIFAIVATTLVFLLAPLVVVVMNSIGRAGIASFPPRELTFESYYAIPSRWLTALVDSVWLGIAAAGLAAALATSAALALSRTRLRHGGIALVLLRTPLQAPSLVVGIAFLQLYVWLSASSGVPLRGSFVGLLLAHTVVSIPSVLAVVLARLNAMDSQYEEAAYGLGAGPVRTFFRVTLPLIGPAVLSGVYFAFLLSLDNVPLSLFLASSSFPLLPIELFTSASFDLTRTLYAVATIVCVLTTVLTTVAFRRLTATLVTAAQV